MPTPEEIASLSYAPPPSPIAANISAFQSDPAFVDPLKLAPIPAPVGGAPSSVPPIGVGVTPSPPPAAVPVPAPTATPAVGPAPAIPALPQANPTGGAPKPAATAKPVTDPTADLAAASKNVEEANAKLAEATAAVGEVEATNLENETELKKQQARDAQIQQSLNKLDLQEADQKIDAIRQQAAKKKFVGLFEGEGGGRRFVLAGLAQILGSVSFDSNHVNQATKLIDDGIRMHFEQQQAEKADLWRQVASAVDQRQMLSKDLLTQMAEFRANQAASLDAVIAQGKSMASRSKNKEGIAALNANNSRLAFERDKAIDESRKLWVASAENERHHRAEEEIQRQHLAVQRANQKKASDIEGEEKVAKIARRLFDENTAKKVSHVAEEAHGLVKMLKENPSALASGLGMERLVSVFSGGGKASVQALKLADHEAGSWADVTADKIMKNLTGKQGEGKRKLLVQIAEQEAAQAEKLKAHSKAAADAGLRGLERKFPDAVKNYKEAIFGSEEAHGSAGGAPPGYTDTGRTSGGKPVYKDPQGNLVVAQ
jgi:hypothetical protein